MQYSSHSKIITGQFAETFHLVKIFINDIPVNLVKSTSPKALAHHTHVIDGKAGKIPTKLLVDDVLIINASSMLVDRLLHTMTDKKLKNLDSVTFASDNKKELVAYIKVRFSIVKAAGGVVEKEGKTLLIFRLGKWDLPKGKLDPGERLKDCALREVQEETGVKCELVEKVCHTWHTYTRNRKYILKKTSWYAMNMLDDSNMAPQKGEGIDDVRWMNLNEMREALYNSYRTVRFVVREYHNLLKETVS